MMSDGQMATFISFLDTIGPCRLLIYCSLGISRSPALALIAADLWGTEYQLTEKARPNPWVLALGHNAAAVAREIQPDEDQVSRGDRARVLSAPSE